MKVSFEISLPKFSVGDGLRKLLTKQSKEDKMYNTTITELKKTEKVWRTRYGGRFR